MDRSEMKDTVFRELERVAWSSSEDVEVGGEVWLDDEIGGPHLSEIKSVATLWHFLSVQGESRSRRSITTGLYRHLHPFCIVSKQVAEGVLGASGMPSSVCLRLLARQAYRI